MNRRRSNRGTTGLVCALVLIMASSALAQQWNRYGPGTRYAASSIYDVTNNQMIIFGGQHSTTQVNFNDVWYAHSIIEPTATFNALNWSTFVPMGSRPSARFGHSAVYNTVSNRMVIFGGGTGFPGPCVNDVWALTNASFTSGTPSWLQLLPTGTRPTAREGQASVYDPATNSLILFGGSNCASGYFADTWVLSNADGITGTATWKVLGPQGSPPSARTGASAAYDSTHNVMIVFGGDNGAVNNEVWLLSGANGATTPTWTQLIVAGTSPSARTGHAAVYDAATNRMIIQGGSNGTSNLSDTWGLTNANGLGGTASWTLLHPTPAGPSRRLHTAIYDPVSNEMVVFGGATDGGGSTGGFISDDHIYVLTHANGK